MLIDLLDSSSEVESAYKSVKRVDDQVYAVGLLPQLHQGQGAHLWAVATPLFDWEGWRFGAIEVVRDVTELKRTEKALRESEERYRVLVNGMKDILYTATADGQMTFIGPQARSLGFQEDEVLGPVFRRLHSAGGPSRGPARVSPYDDDRRGNHGLLPCCPEGRAHSLWLEEIGQAVRDAAGNIVGVSGILRDITERKQAEDRIRQQAALLQETHDAIIVWDVERGVQFMNPAAEHLTGQRLADAMGAGLSQVLRLRSELALRAALQEVMARGAWTGELALRMADGKERNLDSRWNLLRDASGKPKSVLITCNDITEKKSLEVQYLRAQRLERRRHARQRSGP